MHRTPVLLTGIISAVLYVIQFLLGFRFLLRLFGANPATPFVAWVREMSEPLLDPFRNIFPTALAEGRFVIEFSTLFALIVYTLIGYLIIELIEYISYSGRARHTRVVERDEV